jgi:hypothetical protein
MPIDKMVLELIILVCGIESDTGSGGSIGVYDLSETND